MKSKKKTLVEALIYVLLIIVCVWLVPKYVVQRTVVSGESMQDTLQNGESLLVDKVSYHFTDPKRYDIIVFYPKGRDVEEYYVKRMVCREKRYRSRIMIYTLTETRSMIHMPRTRWLVPEMHRNLSNWGMMSILFWVTTDL